ncbi:hypothetical protein ACRE_011170 [Hapsidospora chrysogenum ATCC 11550]|uniref:Uncharacterized protein n=1 Tax=Hapsidospora chrysogenum (strain ATCC 11550 / CBS 779.69 / DSM 880 / IAM 14645 / JCM 23072 / IMI 49137) TaxID=857340 RepID=A0A086TFE1_HAPC1|nr:hypothetical protein ACRE_011170 [Hapsidospora chrysogenum ATCC 11550]
MCLGWHCLTTPEKFGIIFSAAVVTTVLLIAWMYYLGRAAEAHRGRYSRSLPGGRRVPRNPSQTTSNVALGQLPLGQHRPGHPPQVCYQPVIYNVDPQQPPRAYPYLIGGPYHQAVTAAGTIAQGQAASPPVQVQPTSPPFTLPAHRNAIPTGSPRSPMAQAGHPDGPRDEETRSRHYQEAHSQPLTWRQRMDRIFGLPVGRASTIASSRTPSRSTSRSTRESSSGRRTATRQHDAKAHLDPIIRAVSPIRPRSPQPVKPRGKGADADNDDDQSMDSNVATVHSDDYDLPVRQSTKASAVGTPTERREAQTPAHGSQVVKPDQCGVKSNATGVHGELDIVPSVSSLSLEESSSGRDVLPQRTRSRAPRGIQGVQGDQRPKQSDLGSRSSISAGRSLLSREAARRYWESR